MKRLTLVRHCQVRLEDCRIEGLRSAAEPPGPEGAPGMAQRLAEQKAHVDLLITSPAVRALDNGALLRQGARLPLRQLKSEDRLYLARPAEILDVIRGVGTRVQHLAIFGHNPGLSEFAQQITAEPELGELPTCAVYSMEFEIDKWSEARFGAARNASLGQPRNFLDLLS